ncbi:MAG: glycosyltransferase, partial [Ferruginibacter sp.]
DIRRFNTGAVRQKTEGTTRLVSVGSLRTAKNYFYLLEAFEHLKDEPVELHIYGTGHLHGSLQQQINETGVRVILKGEVKNVEEVVPQYDIYVMSSAFEGFSLSVLEAMAMQMPLLLSDIPSFREQCAETAIYFELDNVADLVKKIRLMAAGKNMRDTMSLAAKERAVHNFTLAHHMAGLRKIYSEALNPGT